MITYLIIFGIVSIVIPVILGIYCDKIEANARQEALTVATKAFLNATNKLRLYIPTIKSDIGPLHGSGIQQGIEIAAKELEKQAEIIISENKINLSGNRFENLYDD